MTSSFTLFFSGLNCPAVTALKIPGTALSVSGPFFLGGDFKNHGTCGWGPVKIPEYLPHPNF
jgi:hypothetical protein